MPNDAGFVIHAPIGFASRTETATRDGTRTAVAGEAEPAALALAILAILASFLLGFLNNENSSGGAAFDFASFHWKSIERFSSLPWRQAVRDYPSATNPLIYMLASLAPWGQHGFRLATSVLAPATAILLGIAFRARLGTARMGWLWCAFAGSLILLSPAFRSTSFWGDTDPFPLVFVAITSILLSRFRNATPRSVLADIGITSAVALASFCAFYTRQFYAFLPLISAWMLLARSGVRPAVILGIFAVASLPELLLIGLWHGFNPPSFHKQNRVELSNILLVGANVGLFAAPLALGALRRGLSDLLPDWWDWRATAALAAGLILFNLAFRGITWPDAGGGLLVKAGFKMGPLCTPFILTAAYFGLTAAVLTALRSATNALLVASFLMPFLIAFPVYERYFDPSVFVAMLLFAGLDTSRHLFTPRVLGAYCVFSVMLLTVSLVRFHEIR